MQRLRRMTQCLAVFSRHSHPELLGDLNWRSAVNAGPRRYGGSWRLSRLHWPVLRRGLTVLNQALSSASVLNRLMRIALPDRPTPRVAGVDEFALLKGHRYATIITNAETGERVEVLPDRRRDTVVAWVREHPGIRMLCRDGSGGFARAVREADSTIVQVIDRWHLWHGLTEAVLKEGVHTPPAGRGTDHRCVRTGTLSPRWPRLAA
uniref:Transposase n=1 Tax=Streptomyces sp. NBC_01393 TaxID=2903851 RepID=A0AAU3ICJ5_9ACTN